VFDSGVGGLTVLKAICDILPNENLIYLGDTARLPYGTKSSASIERYAVQATKKLREYNIKMLVVACNTASAAAINALQKYMSPIPVIGVIEPGVEAALSISSANSYLVLATEATVRLGAYSRAIKNRKSHIMVREQSCEILVSLAEEGWTSGQIAELTIKQYLSKAEFDSFKFDSIILGCTHFPLLRETISNIASNTVVIDSAITTAQVVSKTLSAHGWQTVNEESGIIKLLATDGIDRFARIGEKFLGRPLIAEDIQLVDL
jgi:glutamate racemase